MPTEPTPEEKRQLQLFAVGKVFSPAAPIDNRALFAGRVPQMEQIFSAINTRGQHVIVFGERGVGKTSLANLTRIIADMEGSLTVMVNCSDSDTFEKVWMKVFREIHLIDEFPAMGFKPTSHKSVRSLAENVEDQLDPGGVQRILRNLSTAKRTVIVIDEFDRISKQLHQRHFADTIKDLSDRSANTTIILVGVAKDVDELIRDHASIDRCLSQVHMPRMLDYELAEIVRKALASDELKMSIDEEALDLIVLLSQGLPHYAHLIGKESTSVAIKAGAGRVQMSHVEEGIRRALAEKQRSIGMEYQKAISSQRQGTLFESVLLACALAEEDGLGYFSSADVRDPLIKITGKNYDIPNFSQHMDKFSNDATRGPVLEKSGTSRRFRFRFINPLLQPYVIMKGLSDAKINQTLLEALKHRQNRQKII